MNTRIRIAGGIATAALAAGSVALVAGPADAAGASTSSSAQARQGHHHDFNPRLDKVNNHQILARADDINRSNTIKLMSDKGGSWRTVKVWRPSNARDRDFAEVVNVGRVKHLNDYLLRVIDHNSRGRITQVQDSNGGNGGNGGGDTGGNGGGGTTTPGGLGL